jgi:hypothetical protein
LPGFRGFQKHWGTLDKAQSIGQMHACMCMWMWHVDDVHTMTPHACMHDEEAKKKQITKPPLGEKL